jgi:hypothetical protein
VGLTSVVGDLVGLSQVDIAWPLLPIDSELNIQANPNDEDLFYRMDTVRPMSEGNFFWDTSLLQKAAIEPDDFSYAAYLNLDSESDKELVYIPLTLAQVGKSANTYTLLLQLRGDIEQVDFAIGFVGANLADVENFDFNNLDPEDLGYNFYPDLLDIDIELAPQDPTGFYAVKVFVRGDSQNNVPETLFFYHQQTP